MSRSNSADPVALLKELIAVASPSGCEARLAALVRQRAGECGLSAEMIGRNVVIRAGAGNGPTLLLNSHLDTVAPVAGWRQDPFLPRLDGERISGLGANDAKGCVTALLCAVTAAAAEPLPGRLVLAFTVDEEIGGGGEGLEWLIGRLGHLDAAVIGEPTSLDICRAQKGLLILEVTTTGDARHAAHAHRLPGRNAILEAARAVERLEAWQPGHEHPLLGPLTCEVTTIEGGSRRNVIADRCTFCLDLRTVDGIGTAELVRRVQEISGSEVRVRSDRMQPMETSAGSALVAAAQRARPDAELIGSATMSDAVWTRHLPSIKVGPGVTERSHTAGEWITVEELQDGVTFYRQLITEYFGIAGKE